MPQTQFAEIGDLALRSGALLPGACLAYNTYGRLAADGRNAVLVTHGFTSSHRFIEQGGWGSLVGPGAAIDTDRFFVVSSNMLGSAYGSTAPASTNPAAARPYGPDFPSITLPDIVGAQRKMLDLLGVRELLAVVGPSYGGFQAFTWGVEFPDFVRGLVPVESAPRALQPFNAEAMLQRLATDPLWNGGHYYGDGVVLSTMVAQREATLRRYGVEQGLRARLHDEAAVQAEITRQARDWALAFDAHSLLVLGRAIDSYDIWADLGRIRARVLYVLSRTDALFPPTLAHTVLPALAAAGVDTRYFEIDTPHGHFGSDLDVAKWAPTLAAFLTDLAGLP